MIGEFDSGGRIPGAPLGPLVGAHAVAVTLAGAFSGSSATFSTVDVNGQPGVIVNLHGQIMAVIGVDTDGHTVRAIRAIGNPDKLTHLNA